MNREPIAIIGLGCRFPGADHPQAFWQLLCNGIDAITEVPADRWNVDEYYSTDPATPNTMNSRWGGFLNNVDQFDPQFFGISPREAVTMDPQQRLLLEVAWETLEDAGQIPKRLAGTPTGVFVGVSSFDYYERLMESGTLDAYAGTGNTNCITANRLSYVFDFQGPSMAIDTACSSSLVAVHLACQSLWSGESTLALAGGVHVMLSPNVSVSFAKGGFISPDGRCKTFDASANGYVRSEGAGLVLLKPLAQALADSDRIYATICGSAINQDGRSNGLTAPNPKAQEAVLKAAYRRAGISPGQVQYVETHGTGTKLGDPIELKALGAVVATDRAIDQPCAVGSVKTNIGHLEAAAGIAGLMKVALSLYHQQLPPSLHFQTPNPYIPFERLPLRVQQTLKPWPSEEEQIAGVSSFGFGGTNAHIVLKSAPAPVSPSATADRPVHVLTLSAKSATALQTLADRYATYLQDQSTLSLADVCFTANTSRSTFEHRLALPAASLAQIQDQLAAFAKGQPLITGATGQAGKSPKIAFLFTGQGSQYIQMGRQLYETQPRFRETIDRCDALLRPVLNPSLRSVLYPEPGIPSPIDQTLYTQTTLFAVEYALAQLWQSWGVQPDALIGHSLGEYVAACVAGVLSLDDALMLVVERARRMQALPPDGMMAAVFTNCDRVTAAIASQPEVSMAAINAPENLVISGRREAVQAVLDRLKAEGIAAQPLNVSHAFHSPLMEPMLEGFQQVASQVSYAAPRLPLMSNVTGQFHTGAPNASYWCEHLRGTVQFAAGIQTLAEQGYTCFLEIGPSPTLITLGQRSVEQRCTWLPSLKKDREDWQVLLESLACLYTQGKTIDWHEFDREYSRARLSLPTYPFERQRFWIEPPARPVVASPAPAANAAGVDESDDLNEWFYQVKWQPQTLIDRANRAAQNWIILADRQGVAEQLVTQLQQQGHRTIRVERGTAYDRVSSEQVRLCLDRPDDLQQWMTELPAIAGRWNVVHLSSLDSTPASATTAATLEADQQLGCGSLLHLVQALTQTKRQARLWVVTQGAQSVHSPLTAVAQAPVWGLGRAIAQEHPNLWGGLIDLATETTPADAAQIVWQDITHTEGEDQVAYRQGQRYVARLVRSDATVAPKRLQWRSDASYLITGGLGDLGLQVARWMVAQGARQLILMGRTPLPDRRQWPAVKAGSRQADQIAAIQELEAKGASIYLATADVTHERELRACLQDIQAACLPIRGVVHAAAFLQPQVLEQLDMEALQAVLRPKVTGTWLLHHLLQETPLDFFVLFSSAATLLPVLAQGQANYAAANAFLDAIAHYRHAQGQPALSINWGPWAEVGMAARFARLDRLSTRGISSIPPQQGLQALEQLLSSPLTQVAVMPMDWPQAQAFYPANQLPAFLEHLLQPRPHDAGAAPIPLNQTRLLATAPENRRSLLAASLAQQISHALRLPASHIEHHTPIHQMGFDSLMAAELKNQIEVNLNVSIPVSHFLQGISIVQLVEQIWKHIQERLEDQLSQPIMTESNKLQMAIADWEEGSL